MGAALWPRVPPGVLTAVDSAALDVRQRSHLPHVPAGHQAGGEARAGLMSAGLSTLRCFWMHVRACRRLIACVPAAASCARSTVLCHNHARENNKNITTIIVHSITRKQLSCCNSANIIALEHNPALVLD